MEKKKRKTKIDPVLESGEKRIGEQVNINMVAAQEPRYRMVPLDMITHSQLMALCDARGFGQRGQGAYVRVLIKKEFEEAKKSGLLK